MAAADLDGETSAPCVATVGMFDGVHLGHRDLLRQLEELGRLLALPTTVVTFANHPLDVVAPDRAPRLLLTPAEKARRLRSEGVDRVVVLEFTEELRRLSAAEFLRLLRRDYGVRALLLGFNNRVGRDAPATFGGYRELGREEGVEVFLAEEYRTKRDGEDGEDGEDKNGDGEGERVSSSAIRGLLERGDAEGAARLLGHPYRLTGTVVHGHAVGRTIGFPTANLVPDDPRLLVPARGVYAARALGRPAMVNIGCRPTLADTDGTSCGRGETTIEIHIIGYRGDLYGRTITVEFLRRLRQERRFPTLSDLTAQLEKDRQACLEGEEQESDGDSDGGRDCGGYLSRSSEKRAR